MDFRVSAGTLRATTKCKKNFSCLKEKNRDCCGISDCINDEIIFVKSQKPSCPYQQMFGNEFICGCPVRKEIYNKYRI